MIALMAIVQIGIVLPLVLERFDPARWALYIVGLVGAAAGASGAMAIAGNGLNPRCGLDVEALKTGAAIAPTTTLGPALMTSSILHRCAWDKESDP